MFTPYNIVAGLENQQLAAKALGPVDGAQWNWMVNFKPGGHILVPFCDVHSC